MRRRIEVGFVPLVDAAPVLIAREMGFDRDEGLDLLPLPQPSWAALRDLLMLGHLDAAHMLAPLPVALRLGLGGAEAALDVLAVLSLNGSTVVAGTALAGRMREGGWAGRAQDAGPAEAARALAAAPAGGAPPRIGVPFAISTHALLLRYLHERTDLSPPDLVPVPPSRMVEALETGAVDAFCVGEPWGSAAVEAGAGEIVLLGSDIWAAAPEKVLAMRAGADAGLAAALIRAAARAGRWLADEGNLALAGEILAERAPGLPADVVDRALGGRIVPRAGAGALHVPGFLRLGGQAMHFPWRSQGAWIGDRLARAHGGDPEVWARAGAAAFRSDLHRAALAGTGFDLPGASAKIEGALGRAEPVASAGGRLSLGPDRFFDGAVFDSGPALAPHP